jgi:hypothetical protein
MLIVTFVGIAIPENRSLSWNDWRHSFGEIDPRYVVEPRHNNLLLAGVQTNWPQALIAICYYGYNGLFTNFLVAEEMSRFAVYRKGLRLSSRTCGAQRSTYFLSLPYRYAIPISAIGGILHWLCSQSLYLVSVRSQPTASTIKGVVSILVFKHNQVSALDNLRWLEPWRTYSYGFKLGRAHRFWILPIGNHCDRNCHSLNANSRHVFWNPEFFKRYAARGQL